MYLLKLIKLSLNGCVLSYIDYVFKVNLKMATRYFMTPLIKKWDLFPLLESGWSYACFNQQNMAKMTLCCFQSWIINTLAASSRFFRDTCCGGGQLPVESPL